MIFLLIILSLFGCYSILTIYYWVSWEKIPEFISPAGKPFTKISVVIPARDEEKNIGILLKALEDQTYPKELFEVIVVDDDSADNTNAVARDFAFANVVSTFPGAVNSYKKKALETGIGIAVGELIVTTDADCRPGPAWLETIVSFKEKNNSAFIAAPVTINCNSSLVQVFQAMDFMVLQAITGAVVHKRIMSMCNGANIAYERSAFAAVDGFEGIDQIASGDDMLLMYKIQEKFPTQVHYLKSKDAIVSTQPAFTWKAFFSQRIRWASKARKYKDKRILPVLLLVYLVNLSFPVLAIMGFWYPQFWLCLVAFWVLKTLIEFPLFRSAAIFFDKSWAIKYFFLVQPLHIFYTIIAGFFSQVGTYHWKGRRVK